MVDFSKKIVKTRFSKFAPQKPFNYAVTGVRSKPQKSVRRFTWMTSICTRYFGSDSQPKMHELRSFFCRFPRCQFDVCRLLSLCEESRSPLLLHCLLFVVVCFRMSVSLVSMFVCLNVLKFGCLHMLSYENNQFASEVSTPPFTICQAPRFERQMQTRSADSLYIHTFTHKHKWICWWACLFV